MDENKKELTASDKNWVDDKNFEKWIRSLPKIELHVHFDGAFDPFLLHKHLQRHKNTESLPKYATMAWDNSMLPVRSLVQSTLHDPLKFHSLCTCHGKSSLQAMIKCFEIFLPIVRGNLPLLEELAKDFCKRQADQNVIYTEVRYSPHLLATNGFFVKLNTDDLVVDPSPVVDAITRGLRSGEAEFGITVNQILCCVAWRPDWADEIVDLAQERKNDFPSAVVGIDIAAGEEHFDSVNFPNLYKPHYEAFQRAKDLGLNVTIHAGEVASADNITKAVEKYGAKRIGHGYHISGNQALMEYMRDQQIHFEVCPTSSVETGGWVHDTNNRDWKSHPALIMMKNGLEISFNSDDPAVFNTSLTWQMRIANSKMHLEPETIWNNMLKTINATFLSDDQKAMLKKRMIEFKVENEQKEFKNYDFNCERVVNRSKSSPVSGKSV